MLTLQPITYKEACEFIRQHHRHHLPPQGWKFGIAVNDGKQVVGVITVGRPVARMLDDGWTLEVTRSCTDGTRNVNSMLYGAAERATFALGYKRLITYTIATELGTVLLASNWKCLGEAGGGNWNTKSRPRVDSINQGIKTLWESPKHVDCKCTFATPPSGDSAARIGGNPNNEMETPDFGKAKTE